MTTTAAVEMAEFVLLWDAVQQLTSEFPDSISWRWTSGDTYTAKSAYKAQLLCTYSSFKGSWVWKAFCKTKS